MSAFAAGILDDVAKNGVAAGDTFNSPSRDAAEADALKTCHNSTGGSADSRAVCKVIAHFDKQCLAVSDDPKAGTPGYGWAVADTATAANNQALQHCRDTAGADRAAYCEIVGTTDCDTQP